MANLIMLDRIALYLIYRESLPDSVALAALRQRFGPNAQFEIAIEIARSGDRRARISALRNQPQEVQERFAALHRSTSPITENELLALMHVIEHPDAPSGRSVPTDRVPFPAGLTKKSFTTAKLAWLEELAAVKIPALPLRLAIILSSKYLNPETGTAYPGHERLMNNLQVTRPGIQGAFQWLVEHGHLRVDVGGGRKVGGKGKTNSYRPLIKANARWQYEREQQPVLVDGIDAPKRMPERPTSVDGDGLHTAKCATVNSQLKSGERPTSVGTTPFSDSPNKSPYNKQQGDRKDAAGGSEESLRSKNVEPNNDSRWNTIAEQQMKKGHGQKAYPRFTDFQFVIIAAFGRAHDNAPAELKERQPRKPRDLEDVRLWPEHWSADVIATVAGVKLDEGVKNGKPIKSAKYIFGVIAEEFYGRILCRACGARFECRFGIPCSSVDCSVCRASDALVYGHDARCLVTVPREQRRIVPGGEINEPTGRIVTS